MMFGTFVAYASPSAAGLSVKNNIESSGLARGTLTTKNNLGGVRGQKTEIGCD